MTTIQVIPLMITIAAVLGMLPMALGQGIGAEMRNGVGFASAGGILISGVLTLVILPIIYDLFTRGRKNTEPKAVTESSDESDKE